ncbi:MAG: isoleucine--tRNA ligase, partial [Caulobacteraceae bacterium]
MPNDASPAPDYRATVFLPETEFPMRAGLPAKEPGILERWAELDLYRSIRKARQDAGAPLFVLHDGPPYANGHIHIGHALDKTLKDFVVRSRFLLGYDVDYVPGWDCHGLPIEWQIEKEFKAKGRSKDEVPPAEFRARCREYASQWIDIQRDEFKRLGVLGDWDGRYATMDFTTEAKIVQEFHKFLMSGQLYRGSKPVMWSPVERTALADAEVEYHDHVSPTVWVKFPVVGGAISLNHLPNEQSVVIWTTTPWTIPGNRAIAYGPDIKYGLYEVSEMPSAEELGFAPWAAPGDRLIIADKLAEDVRQSAKITSWARVQDVDPSDLTCAHPLRGKGYDFDVPLLAGDHVTDDAGTGFVHTAPGHGQEDYQVWLAHGYRDIPETVDPDGAYYPDVPLFGGLKVLETEGKKAGKFGPANGAVMDALIEAGNLLARGRLEHSYPHSWRSKAPVIFRNTPQWFIRMDEPIGASFETPASRAPQDDAGGRKNVRHAEEQPEAASRSTQGDTLRQRALAAIDATAFYPEIGRNRIRGMVEGRPDWLISRQRAWGTPLAMFVDKETGEPLRDEAVNTRIRDLIAKEGADAWYLRPASDFLGGHDPEQYEKVDDILDVWFDSGSTHAFTLEGRADSHWPADLYSEGSDQHRGWFQSSLLEGCGTRGRAPYKALMTHGFTLDEQGEKMSKSKGNTIEPQTIIKESGADILRLWTAMVDYTDDQRIGKQILQTTADAYRKMRNSVRYLLGALAGFDAAERVTLDLMPPLERFILHRLWELDAHVREAYGSYDFQGVWRAVSEFSSGDLSALYFDIRKDALYCDAPSSLRRRACRTVMHEVFMRLTAWLSPLIPFTMEEAWTMRFPDAGSNCLRVIPETPGEWENGAEASRWNGISNVLEVVTGALEIERREKRIGGALEAAPVAHVADADLRGAFAGVDPAEVFRTSTAILAEGEGGAFHLDEVKGVGVDPVLAEGEKCARCWRVLAEV